MSPTKAPTRVPKDEWTAFLNNARTHLRDAENKLTLLEDNTNAKGIAADAVLAAIAFGDAITVQRLGVHNAQDHGQLPDLVERALGKQRDNGQITRLRRILARKGEAHYGGKYWMRDDATEYLEQVRRFANWAENMLQERA
jgi:hypothetical protein